MHNSVVRDICTMRGEEEGEGRGVIIDRYYGYHKSPRKKGGREVKN